MISWVKEVHHTILPIYYGDEEDKFLQGKGPSKYYTYLVCKNNSSGRRNRYDVFKIDECDETIKAIGREVPYKMCRDLINKEEPNGTTVVLQKTISREHRVRDGKN